MPPLKNMQILCQHYTDYIYTKKTKYLMKNKGGFSIPFKKNVIK